MKNIIHQYNLQMVNDRKINQHLTNSVICEMKISFKS